MIFEMTKPYLVRNCLFLRSFCSQNLRKLETSSAIEETRIADQVDDLVTPVPIHNEPIIYSPEQLFKLMKLEKDSKQILNYVNSCRMNKAIIPRNVFLILNQIYKVQVKDSTNTTSEDITQEPNFKELCQNLNDSCQRLNHTDVIQSLRIISHFGIKADSTVALKLLNLMVIRMDFLSIKEMISLYFLLAELEPTTDAHTNMRITLLKRFHKSIDWQLDSLSPSELTDILSMVTNCKEFPFSNEKILPIIEVLGRKRHMLSTDQTQSVLSSLLQLDTFWIEYPLLFGLCLRKINCPSELNSSDLIRIIEILAILSSSSETPVLLKKDFLRKCAEIAVKRDIGFNRANHLHEQFQIINFEDKDLSEYVAKTKLKEARENTLGRKLLNIYCSIVQRLKPELKSK